MLSSISLKNYKCFKQLRVRGNEDLDIKPLTILCGVNSSGKSSIIKSLLMLKQSYENSYSSNELTFNGDYVKCGRFEDISSNHNNEPITLSTSYELNKPVKYHYARKKHSKYDITAFKNLNKMYNNRATQFLIKSSITIEKNDSNRMVDNNILSEQRIEVTAIFNPKARITSIIQLRKIKNQLSQYVISLENIPDGDNGNIVERVRLRDAVCYFENFNLINVYSTNIEPVGTHISGLLANVYLIFKMNALQFKNIHYLTPLRGYPQRNYLLDCEIDDVGSSGEFTPYIMHKHHGERIDGFFPPKNDSIEITKDKVEFDKCIQRWMDYLHFGKYSLSNSLETIQLNIRDKL